MQRLLTVLAMSGAVLLTTAAAHAEYMGLPTGRSGDLSKLPQLSVEAGFVTGEFANADYSHLGGRLNYKLSPEIVLYGDLGQTKIADWDSVTFGFGAFYQLQNFVEFGDTSVKASFHRGRLSQTGLRDYELDILAVELVVGGKEPIAESGMRWYANLGIHYMDNSGDNEIEASFGGGVLLPIGPGEVFFGIDHIDELTFGGGYRLAIN